jgi:hypothetical protein
VSWKLLSSGTSPALVVYVPRPEGLVKVCGRSLAIAPLGDAPVNVSRPRSSDNLRSSPKSRTAIAFTLASCTRPSLSP